MIKYLTKEQIIEFNRQVTKGYGETHALLSPANLEYAIDATKNKFRDQDDGGIIEKCALLMELIVKTHPFIDGNKRTALLCAKDFLKNNGFILKMDNPKQATMFMLEIATERAGHKAIREYINERVIKHDGNI